ncbi:MAG TPA: chromate transporter [Burkholderiaceae bacterium]|nr:chromate transporter [Burkholderiaceae bacterium]
MTMMTTPDEAAPPPESPPPSPSSTSPDLAAPANLRELFLAFNRLALQGFGGVLPVAQRELVERLRWLDKQQFVEMLAVSQVLPGPNIINLALMFGDRWFGARGAVVALAGMMAAPLVIVLVLAVLYGQYAQQPLVGGALRGMGAVAAGLVLSTALKLSTTVRRNPMGRWIAMAFAALTFVLTALLRWPLVWVVLGLGSIAIAVAWYRLGRAAPPSSEPPPT